MVRASFVDQASMHPKIRTERKVGKGGKAHIPRGAKQPKTREMTLNDIAKFREEHRGTFISERILRRACEGLSVTFPDINKPMFDNDYDQLDSQQGQEELCKRELILAKAIEAGKGSSLPSSLVLKKYEYRPKSDEIDAAVFVRYRHGSHSAVHDSGDSDGSHSAVHDSGDLDGSY